MRRRVLVTWSASGEGRNSDSSVNYPKLPTRMPTSANMGSKLNLEGMMLFEQPFARVSGLNSSSLHKMLNTHGGMQVPYENYRKIFRTSQRHVERELGAVLTASNELSSRATSGTLDTGDVLKSMDNMIGRVENLKRKVNSTHPQISYCSPLKIAF